MDEKAGRGYKRNNFWLPWHLTWCPTRKHSGPPSLYHVYEWLIFWNWWPPEIKDVRGRLNDISCGRTLEYVNQQLASYALGIFISYDERQNNKKNFFGKIDKLGAKLEVWRSRNLSILGRCLVTKCPGIPQLVFSMSILDAPKSCVPTINTSIFQFIWKKRQDELMYQNYDRGGLRVPNVDVMIKSLRLAWIPCILSYDEKRNEVWKTIQNHYFDSYGGLNSVLTSS